MGTFPNHATKKLYKWLIRMAGDGGGRVSLGHVGATGPGVPLGQWAIRQEDDDETLRKLAAVIADAASDDTDGQAPGLPQQYVTLFYPRTQDGETSERSTARCTFRLATQEQFAPEGSVLATEPANERGLLSQAIRHNEFLVRTSFGAMGSASSQLERHNHILSEQLHRLTEQVFEMQAERQALLDREAERMLEISKFEAERDHRTRMTSEMLAAVKGGLALFANRGQPLQLPAPAAAVPHQLPAVASAAPSAAPETAATPAEVVEPALPAPAPAAPSVPPAAMVALSQLKDLFESLTPEQIQQIGSVLTPMQQASLFSLYQLFAGLEDDVVDAEVEGPSS